MSNELLVVSRRHFIAAAPAAAFCGTANTSAEASASISPIDSAIAAHKIVWAEYLAHLETYCDMMANGEGYAEAEAIIDEVVTREEALMDALLSCRCTSLTEVDLKAKYVMTVPYVSDVPQTKHIRALLGSLLVGPVLSI